MTDGGDQPSPRGSLQNEIFPGSEDFVEDTLATLDDTAQLEEIPRLQRRTAGLTPSDYEARCATRDPAIARACESADFTLKEIR
jgi:hypothetical protein